MRPSRGVRTWPETVRKAEALERIVLLLDAYLAPEAGTAETGASEREVLLDIVAIIEGVHIFPRAMAVINPDDTKGRA